MGGFFGAISRHDAIADVFFGADYHSHLGTRRGGIAAYDSKIGLQRDIHNIENTPFRTKFENVFNEMKGNSAIGVISDSDPQPLLIRSEIGTYAIATIGRINNAEELIQKHLVKGAHFGVMTGGKVNSTDLVAALINEKNTFAEGIKYVHDVVEGTVSILILTNEGKLIAARDKVGRLPILIGSNEDGYAVSFEDFAYKKLGYDDEMELGPGEAVEITLDGIKQLIAPGKEMKICAFLWSYYGYPNSVYEGKNVETMRYRNGEIMAQTDKANGKAQNIDFVSGVPDSGTPHAIGYANASGIPFARPFIKYTPTWPRSFTPKHQTDRVKIARMKQVPIHELIEDKNLLFVDDSIVRGTQLKETVDFLYQHGAKSVHMRSACPPIMYGCKYLNFTSSKNEMELIARQTVMELEGEEGFNHIEEYSDGNTERGKKLREKIAKDLGFETLDFQSLEGVIKAIGLNPCDLCTYCWSGKE